jgi:hypothetical protein
VTANVSNPSPSSRVNVRLGNRVDSAEKRATTDGGALRAKSLIPI